MNIADLKPNQLAQTPDGTVVKVHIVYSPNRVSAEIVLPVLPRTTVRFYDAVEVAGWRQPTDATYARYEQAWTAR